jgi:ferredoxin-NADP reductase
VIRLALGGVPFAYRAGQAVMLGVPGRPERKPYSLASAPEDARARGYLEFLVKTDGESGIGAELVALRRGARVVVEGPIGAFRFPARQRARRLLFVAGGTGIAPLRAMLHHALHEGYGGRIGLLYSARSPEHFAFAAELRRLARRRQIVLRMTATRSAPRGWRGERGRIVQRHLKSLVTDSSTLCFVCGPSALVAAVPRRLRRLGVAPRLIRMESWKG